MFAEEISLRQDPRLHLAIARFNDGDWYGAHDLFEELWHEIQGPSRLLLQGVLQISVAQLHLERGNNHGATVLMGEGVGRLSRVEHDHLGLNILILKNLAVERLRRLQQGLDLHHCPPLQLCPASAKPSVH